MRSISHRTLHSRRRLDKSWRKRGFTLIELMVLLCIIGILMALLLPAIQRARESARKGACKSNLRQIGMALHAYESVHQCFPVSAVFVKTLPYLEMRHLYEEVTATESCCGGIPSPGVYRCPSASLASAQTGYASSFGTGVVLNDFNGMFSFGGVFPRWNGHNVVTGDVLDGLSQTAAVSEILPADGRETRERRSIVWELDGISDPQLFADVCRQIHDGRRQSVIHGMWRDGNPGSSAYYHMLTPNQTNCWGEAIGLWPAGVFTAASAHEGGVHLLLADGHVRFIANEIDADIWIALGSRKGGESVGQF